MEMELLTGETTEPDEERKGRCHWVRSWIPLTIYILFNINNFSWSQFEIYVILT